MLDLDSRSKEKPQWCAGTVPADMPTDSNGRITSPTREHQRPYWIRIVGVTRHPHSLLSRRGYALLTWERGVNFADGRCGSTRCRRAVGRLRPTSYRGFLGPHLE